MPLSFVERARRAALIAPLAVFGVAAISASSALAVPDPQSGGGTTSMSAAAPAVAAEAPARPAAPKPVATTLQADINLTTQQLTVTAGGKVLHVWPISSGRQGYETPRGSFRPQWAAKMHFSKKYDDAPMPHSVFFNGGIATHATQATGMLGRPASHGCVRLSPTAAATFYGLVHKHGYQATRIVVRGTPKFPDEAVASRRSRDRDDGRPRIAARPYPPPYGGYAYAQPGYGYSYAPQYIYDQPRRVYVMPRQAYGPAYGQMRYIPQGYVRY